MLVPVLAGYWLLSQTHLFKRAYTDDKSNYELFFASAIVGVILFSVAWLIVAPLEYFADQNPCLDWTRGLWKHIAPLDHSGTVGLAIGIAVVFSGITNRRISDEEAAARWALENENRMGCILRESLEGRRLVEVSLTNGKSYIGFVVEEDPGGWEQDVALVPVLSGYRNIRTKRLVLTKNYASAGRRSLKKYAVVMPMREIVSICRFDLAVHRELNSRGARSSA